MAHPKTIGILLPHLNAGYDMAILRGAHMIARQQGVQLIAVWGSPGDLRASSPASNQLAGWIAVLNIPRPESIRDIARAGMPLVVIGALVPDLGCPAVLPDNFGGTLAAVRHLLDHGHRHIAFVGDLRVDDMRERLAGYQAALAERDIPVDSRFVFGNASYYSPAGGIVAARQLIDAGFPCSAIVAGNDLYALAVVQTVRDAGYRVPEDLAVIGFDDLPQAQSTTPPLTTVRQSYTALGTTAAQLLLAQLSGQEVAPGATYVPTKLIIRHSCGCAMPEIVASTVVDNLYIGPGWQDVLAQQLVRLALHPLPLDPTIPPTQVWPGLVDILKGLETAVSGTQATEPIDLQRAWREAIALTANLETLHAMLRLIERAGAQWATAAPKDPALQARVQAFLDTAGLELLRAQSAQQRDRDDLWEALVNADYLVSMAMLEQHGKAADLAWLSQTPLRWACLGRWAEPDADGAPTLVVAGTYSRAGEPMPPIGARYAAADFPPPDSQPTVARAGGPEVLIVLPVRTAAHNWGVLAVCRPVESREVQTTLEDVRMWVTLLSAALDREALLESLTERQDTLSIAYEQRLITENIRDLIFLIDRAGCFLYASPSFQHVLGYSPSGLIGISAFDFIHPEDVDTVREPWAQINTLSSLQATFRFRHADTSWRWLEASGTVIMQHGLPTVVIVGRDITERKRLEADVLQSQKMDSIGRLAGGVAHDFNNLLTVISGCADLALTALSPIDSVRSDLEAIQQAAERASGLTRQLLAFARKQIIEPRVLNLNDLILDADRLLRRLIGEDIELLTIPAPDLRQVKVDPGQIEQILVNLAINARDAMPNGGRLTIETANVSLGQGHTLWHAGITAGSYVMLVVQDTGIGMNAEVQAHLFEPFFTTKDPGKGTGLGLAMCYGIIKQHNGHITVQSKVGRGTIVKILLPAIEDPAPAPPYHADLLPVARGTETVLLVEDEQMVRNLAARVLRAQGYTVLEAGDGEEALRIARDHAGAIALLLTDVVMPRLGGKAVAERLTAMRAGLKVLFMSGYTDKVMSHHGELPPGVVLLQKPFSPAVLVQKVREVLDA